MTTNTITHKLPLVSIIIPTYNYAKYISRAIDSALSQTYPNIEVIVIDDGSTDETSSVVTKYGRRLSYLRQENKGASSARNLGISVSHGEYIAFLDADDQYRLENVEHKVQFLQDHKEYRWVYSDWVWIDQLNREIARGSQDKNTLASLHATGNVFLLALKDKRLQTNVFLFEREILVRAGGFDERLTIREDYDLYLRLAYSYPISYLDEPLVEIYPHIRSLGNRSVEESYRMRWCLNRKIQALYPNEIKQIRYNWRRIQSDVYRNLATFAYRRKQYWRAGILLNTSLKLWPLQPGGILERFRLMWKRK
jgi:glycosyltransferase involved in cell wall biosynthesis